MVKCAKIELGEQQCNVKRGELIKMMALKGMGKGEQEWMNG